MSMSSIAERWREVRGSVTNVIGLPLVEVLEALRSVGAPSARFGAGTPA